MEIQQQSKVLDQGDLISKLLLKIDASEKRMDKKDVKNSELEKCVDQISRNMRAL